MDKELKELQERENILYKTLWDELDQFDLTLDVQEVILKLIDVNIELEKHCNQ